MEHGAAPKTKGENLGGANRREERTNLPEHLALESIMAERCGLSPMGRTLSHTKYGPSKMIGQR